MNTFATVIKIHKKTTFNLKEMFVLCVIQLCYMVWLISLNFHNKGNFNLNIIILKYRCLFLALTTLSIQKAASFMDDLI